MVYVTCILIMFTLSGLSRQNKPKWNETAQQITWTATKSQTSFNLLCLSLSNTNMTAMFVSVWKLSINTYTIRLASLQRAIVYRRRVRRSRCMIQTVWLRGPIPNSSSISLASPKSLRNWACCCSLFSLCHHLQPTTMPTINKAKDTQLITTIKGQGSILLDSSCLAIYLYLYLYLEMNMKMKLQLKLTNQSYNSQLKWVYASLEEYQMHTLKVSNFAICLKIAEINIQTGYESHSLILNSN